MTYILYTNLYTKSYLICYLQGLLVLLCYTNTEWSTYSKSVLREIRALLFLAAFLKMSIFQAVTMILNFVSPSQPICAWQFSPFYSFYLSNYKLYNFHTKSILIIIPQNEKTAYDWMLSSGILPSYNLAFMQSYTSSVIRSKQN